MKSRIMAILVAPFLLAIPMQAAVAEVWTVFKDMSGKDLTMTGTNYNLDVGQQFQAEVWFKSTADWSNSKLLFRFGTATIKYGPDIEKHFLHDPYTDTEVKTLVFDRKYNWGDYALPAEPSGTRAYANYLEMYNSTLHIGGQEYLGVVYTLRNNMALGDSGQISIYTNPDHSVIPAGTTVNGVYAPVKEYTLTTIPEPSSLMAMGCAGVGVLGNLWHRRRKKTSAQS